MRGLTKSRRRSVASLYGPVLAALLCSPIGGPPAMAQTDQNQLQTSFKPHLQAAASAAGSGADLSQTPLRDIKPLRPAKAARWPYVLGVLLLAACLGIIFWRLWRRRQRRRAAARAKSLRRPAHVVALEALQALHRVNFADEAAVRQYYFDISEVLRAYVTERFELMASQLTTEEIFSRLPRLAELATPENLRLRTFLAQTDQVKYALHQATPEEIGATHAQAVAFIEATLIQAAPAPHPTTGAG